jgi:GTP1/Obg family GTP-binding protein
VLVSRSAVSEVSFPETKKKKSSIKTITNRKIFPSGFYTRKVKYTQETFGEKFQHILDGFPRLQDIHPFRKFYSDDHSGEGSNIRQTRI